MIASRIDRMDGDAVDQAGFEGSHVVYGLHDRVGDGGALLHVKDDGTGGTAAYRHLPRAGAGGGAITGVGVGAGADDGAVAQTAGVFPAPAGCAGSRAYVTAFVVRQEHGGVAA